MSTQITTYMCGFDTHHSINILNSSHTTYLEFNYCDCDKCKPKIKFFFQFLRITLDNIMTFETNNVTVHISYDEWLLNKDKSHSWEILDDVVSKQCYLISSVKTDILENFGVLFGVDNILKL